MRYPVDLTAATASVPSASTRNLPSLPLASTRPLTTIPSFLHILTTPPTKPPRNLLHRLRYMQRMIATSPIFQITILACRLLYHLFDHVRHMERVLLIIWYFKSTEMYLCKSSIRTSHFSELVPTHVVSVPSIVGGCAGSFVVGVPLWVSAEAALGFSL